MTRKRKITISVAGIFILMVGGVYSLQFLPIKYVHKGDLHLVAPQVLSNAPLQQLLEQVDVRQIDFSIWTFNNAFMQETLFDTFANTPHEKAFSEVDWNSEYWNVCRDHLLAKAKTLNLDAKSLRACLAKIEKNKGGRHLLPVAAYSAKHCGMDMWIIVLRWEVWGNRLGHVSIVAFRRWNHGLISEVSCM